MDGGSREVSEKVKKRENFIKLCIKYSSSITLGDEVKSDGNQCCEIDP